MDFSRIFFQGLSTLILKVIFQELSESVSIFYAYFVNEHALKVIFKVSFRSFFIRTIKVDTS